MGFGKKAARNIDQRLMGAARFEKIMPEFEYSKTPPEASQPMYAPRAGARCRRGSGCSNFKEAMFGLTARGGAGRGRPLPALRHPREPAWAPVEDLVEV